MQAAKHAGAAVHPSQVHGAPGAGWEHPACCSSQLSAQDTRLCTGAADAECAGGVCRCCIPTRHCGVHCDGVLQRPKSQTGLGHAPKGSRHDRSPRLHPSGIWGVPPVFPSTFFPLRLGGGGNVCLQEAGLWLNSPPVGDPV